MALDKEKLAKLRKAPENVPEVVEKVLEKAAELAPVAETPRPDPGYRVGRNKSTSRKATYSYDDKTIDKLNELVFVYKRKRVKGVSASRIIRVSVEMFAKLDPEEQLRLLRE